MRKEKKIRSNFAVTSLIADISHKHIVILHYDKKKGECRTKRYFESVRDHIHTTVITIYCSVLSLVVIYLLIYLTYKLNFIISVCR